MKEELEKLISKYAAELISVQAQISYTDPDLYRGQGREDKLEETIEDLKNILKLLDNPA